MNSRLKNPVEHKVCSSKEGPHTYQWQSLPPSLSSEVASICKAPIQILRISRFTWRGASFRILIQSHPEIPAKSFSLTTGLLLPPFSISHFEMNKGWVAIFLYMRIRSCSVASAEVQGATQNQTALTHHNIQWQFFVASQAIFHFHSMPLALCWQEESIHNSETATCLDKVGNSAMLAKHSVLKLLRWLQT